MKTLLIFLTILVSQVVAQVDYDSLDYKILGLSGGGVMTNLFISPLNEDMLMVSTNMGSSFLSTEGPKKWRMIHNITVGYLANNIGAFHPKDTNTIFAPDNGMLKVSRNSGKSWEAIGNLGLLEKEVAIHPNYPDTMLAGSNSSVWLSVNGGENWNQASGPVGNILGFHFDTRSANGSVFYAATSQGLWRSDNGGDTWNKKVNGLPLDPLTNFAAGSNISNSLIALYVQAGDSIYKSSDNGDNWSSLDLNLLGQTTFLLTTDVNPEIVWVVINSSRIVKSINGGSSWDSLYFPEAIDTKFNLEHNYFTSYMGTMGNHTIISATIAPNNPDFVMFTTEMLCMYTKDGGQNWYNAHTTPVIKTEEPKPLSFINTGLNVTTTWHYYIDPFEPHRHYIAYTDLGFSRSLDSGNTWLFWPYWGEDQTLPWRWHNTCYEMAFDPEIPGKIWAAFSRVHDIPNYNAIVGTHISDLPEEEKQGGIAFSSDFTANWEHLDWNTGLPNKPAISIVVDSKSPKNNRILYTSIYDNGVYKSVDDGRTWVKKSSGLGSATNMHVTRLTLHDDGTLFCLVTAVRGFSLDGVGLYKTVNGGDSWTLVNSSKLFGWPKDFTLNPNNSDEIYIGTSWGGAESGALWRTLDGGLEWTSLASKSNTFGAYLHPSRVGWIYMSLCEEDVDTSGLWLSRDNGDTWEPYTKIPHQWIQRVTFDPNNDDVIYVTTFGSNVYKLPADPTKKLNTPSVGTKEIKLNLRDAKYPRLISAPNPFNPSTVISYRLPKCSRASYLIYSISGRKIKSFKLLTSSNNKKSSLFWNGSDDDGVPVSSGIYIGSLIVDGREIVSHKLTNFR